MARLRYVRDADCCISAGPPGWVKSIRVWAKIWRSFVSRGFVRPDDGLSIWWMGDDKLTFLATCQSTNGACAFWIDEPPGHVGPPKHLHSREEEGFFVIEGDVEFKADNVDAVLTKGDFIALPKGIPHSWITISVDKANLITFTAPAGNEGF